MAQQESQSLSQNIKLGLQYRFQNGEVRVNHSRFLGYTKNEEGNLIIEPVEAEVVKRIYREYLEEASLLQIERGLETDGILTGAGKTKWRPETLKKILQCSRLPTPERGIWRVRKKLPIGIDGFSNNISNTEDGGWK